MYNLNAVYAWKKKGKNIVSSIITKPVNSQRKKGFATVLTHPCLDYDHEHSEVPTLNFTFFVPRPPMLILQLW